MTCCLCIIICFKLVDFEKKPHLVFITSAVDTGFTLFRWQRCSEARTVLFYVHGGLSKWYHFNYIVYFKPKILMDSGLKVPLEKHWQHFLPIMTFLFSSIFIFQSTLLVTSLKVLLFLLKTFSPLWQGEESRDYSWCKGKFRSNPSQTLSSAQSQSIKLRDETEKYTR